MSWNEAGDTPWKERWEREFRTKYWVERGGRFYPIPKLLGFARRAWPPKLRSSLPPAPRQLGPSTRDP